jgi:hypothetical protein
MTTALGIASIPERSAGLRRVLDRLLPQVDQAYVYLDKYPDVPEFLRDPKITVYESHLHGDCGGPGKFLGAMHHTGYYLTVDDDIDYPKNYVAQMQQVVARSNNHLCAGVHGVILRPPITNYYRDRATLHFRKRLRVDTPVHILGTGTLCFHTAMTKFSLNWLEHNGSSDITVSLELEQQGVPRICVARKAKWLTPFEETQPQLTLYGQGIKNPVIATELVNSATWKRLAA